MAGRGPECSLALTRMRPDSVVKTAKGSPCLPPASSFLDRLTVNMPCPRSSHFCSHTTRSACALVGWCMSKTLACTASGSRARAWGPSQGCQSCASVWSGHKHNAVLQHSAIDATELGWTQPQAGSTECLTMVLSTIVILLLQGTPAMNRPVSTPRLQHLQNDFSQVPSQWASSSLLMVDSSLIILLSEQVLQRMM